MPEFKEFRVGDLFEKLKTRYVGQGDKFNAVSKVKTAEFKVPVVYAKFGDNGIMYWARENDFLVHENVISVVYNGAISAGRVYAQKERTGILAEAYLIKVKNENVSFQTNLYLATLLEKKIYDIYSRDYLATWTNKVENEVISLPVTQDGTPDWKYMEDYVKKIEAYYVKKIEAYLQVLGYPDVESVRLTETDRAILERHANAEFAEFRIGDLFDFIKRGKRIKSADRLDGKLPFVTAGEGEMGISAYISNAEAERFKSNSLTIDMFGATRYRGYMFGADDHVTVLQATTNDYSKLLLQYVQPNIEKAIAGQYSYSKNFYASDAPDIYIKLPISKKGEPNIPLMEDYMKVIEKKTVAKLVQELDTKLKAFEEVTR